MKRNCILLMSIVTCSLYSQAGESKLNVVATTPEFGAIAAEVGSDFVQVVSLAKPTEDAHFVDAKPSHAVKLSRADVLVEGGAELETGWLPPLLDNSRNAKLAAGQPGHVACAEGLALLEVPSSLDRSKGDLHAMGNPHYMTDPVNAAHAAARICEAFTAIDAAHADAYRARLAAFTNRLSERLIVWQQQLAPYQGRRVVAFHNSWPYFAHRFGLRIDLFLEPKPGIPPSPAHLAEVITTMKAEKINVILLEPYQNRRTAETVADKTGAVIVPVTQYPGGIKGTEAGYIQMMDGVVAEVAQALKGDQTTKGGNP
jgi:zinc/manganese transport system substrate-binding protein